jgi:hypothetical protein
LHSHLHTSMYLLLPGSACSSSFLCPSLSFILLSSQHVLHPTVS